MKARYVASALLAGSLAVFGVVVEGPTVSAQSGLPAVTGVSGSLSHGSTVTVIGSGFGSKPAAAPLKFDDFQGISVGALISTSLVGGPQWRNAGSNAFNPMASNQRLRPGTPYTRNMQSRWRQPADGGNASSSVYLSGQTFTKFYLDAWMYFDRSLETSPIQNVKMFRLHSASAGVPSANPAMLPGGAVACQRASWPSTPRFTSAPPAWAVSTPPTARSPAVWSMFPARAISVATPPARCVP